MDINKDIKVVNVYNELDESKFRTNDIQQAIEWLDELKLGGKMTIGYSIIATDINGNDIFIQEGDKEFKEKAKIEKSKDNKPKRHVEYFAVSDVCENIGTVVPKGQSEEQKRFNLKMKSEIGNVAEYVAQKLKYRSVEDLCFGTDEKGKKVVRFANEQVDAIATIIYNYELTGDSTIIADQTGVGKGRVGAGIIRYAIEHLGTIPVFMTEKETLLNDIYRDLIDIGYEAGVPEYCLEKELQQSESLPDKDIIKIIKSDIKENQSLRYDFDFNSVDYSTIDPSFRLDEFDYEDEDDDYEFIDGFYLGWLVEKITISKIKTKTGKNNDLANEVLEAYQDLIDEVIGEIVKVYRQGFEEDGGFYKIKQVPNPDYVKCVEKAIKEGKKQLRPLLFKAGDIKDPEGNILYKKRNADFYNRLYKKKKDGNKLVYDNNLNVTDFSLDKLPTSEFSIVCAHYPVISKSKYTYPAKSKNYYTQPKIYILQNIINNGVLILDESHNLTATGTRLRRGSERANITLSFIQMSKLTVFMSATFAKRPDSMPIYAVSTAIKEAKIDTQELIDVFNRGGNSLLEATSSELVNNGELVRREKLIRGTTLYLKATEEDALGQSQIEKHIRLGNYFIEFRNLSKIFKQYIRQYNRVNKTKITHTGNINRLSYSLFNTILLGMKSEQAIKYAINEMNNGRKPVITVSNTLESIFNNISKSNYKKVNYSIGDRIKNDISLYMIFLLQNIFSFSYRVDIIDENGQPDTITKKCSALDPDTVQDIAYLPFVLGVKSEIVSGNLPDGVNNFDELYTMLSNETFGIPLSPIDNIKHRINNSKYGYSIDEITGRSKILTFTDDTSYGILTDRKKLSAFDTVRNFNTNITDCLLINQSGGTGLSMHSTLKNTKLSLYEPYEYDLPPTTSLSNSDDKNLLRGRTMIVTQMEADIAKEVQKLGRISRTGEQYPAKYIYIQSVIPAETRLTAKTEQKLRMLNSSTSSDQEQQEDLFESEDLLSITGADALRIVLPRHAQALKLDISELAIEKLTTKSDVDSIIKLLYFSSYEAQKNFFNDFVKTYREILQYKIENGTYTEAVSYKDYEAEKIFETLYYLGNPNSRTSFGWHSIINKSKVKLYRDKITQNKISSMLNDYCAMNDSNTGTIKTFFSYKEYQKFAIDEVNIISKKLIDNINSNNDYNYKQIDILKRQKIEYNESIKEFDEINIAIQLSEEINNLSKEIASISELITKYLQDGDIENMQTSQAKASELSVLKKNKSEEFKKYESILNRKDEYERIKKSLGEIDGKIDDFFDSIDSNNREIDEIKEKTNKILPLINLIGTIQTITDNISNEKKIYDDSNNLIRYEYSPNTYKVCIIGCDLKKLNYFDFNYSCVILHYVTVSEKKSIAASGLYKRMTDDNKVLGKKPDYEITLDNQMYDDNNKWDKYAGKSDTSYYENKYFITGSILKSFSLSNSELLSGLITKYSAIDSDGKKRLKLGIEISDLNKKSDTIDYSYNTYEMLDNIYSNYDEETNAETLTEKPYKVYTELNSKTLDIICEYIYNREYVQQRKQVLSGDLDFYDLKDEEYGYGTYYFGIQIKDSAGMQLFLKVKPLYNSLKSNPYVGRDTNCHLISRYIDKDKFLNSEYTLEQFKKEIHFSVCACTVHSKGKIDTSFIEDFKKISEDILVLMLQEINPNDDDSTLRFILNQDVIKYDEKSSYISSINFKKYLNLFAFNLVFSNIATSIGFYTKYEIDYPKYESNGVNVYSIDSIKYLLDTLNQSDTYLETMISNHIVKDFIGDINISSKFDSVQEIAETSNSINDNISEDIQTVYDNLVDEVLQMLFDYQS